MTQAAYIYRAALYCEQCANLHRADIATSEIPDNYGDDSEHYPQGPYSNGGGEADAPQHCDRCGLFLENPLTTDGVQYVRELMYRSNPMHPSPALQEWAAFYGAQLCECNSPSIAAQIESGDAAECVPCFYRHKAEVL